jgi:transcriptional antiterminator
MSIVGQLVGKTKKVHEDDIYECMLDLHDMGKKITISKIAGLLNCSSRTVYRNMGNELKKEKELLNKEL